MSKFASGRQISETQGTIIIDHYALMILNKLQAMYIDADFVIHTRREGFIFLGKMMADQIYLSDDKEGALRVYAQHEAERMQYARNALTMNTVQRTTERRQNNPTPDFMEGISLCVIDREWAHKAFSPEIENPLPLKMETWVHDLTEQRNDSFGFVIYRNSYEGTTGEWEAFKAKLEAGLESGWEGMVGVENVKSKATLHWIE